MRYGHGVGTSFLDGLTTRDLSARHAAVLEHPLWAGLSDGTTTVEMLRQFTIQDAWLIREIHRLDGLAIAKAPDPEAADVLIAKLAPKSGALDLLVRFGTAIGLPADAVRHPKPLAGCTGLVTAFYYHLARSSFAEAVAALGASETIFLELCARWEEPLKIATGLTQDEIAFFAFHDGLEAGERAITPLMARLLEEAPELAEPVTDAVALTYDLEVLFYDTVRATPWREDD